MASPLYTMEPIPDAGFGLVATSPIPRGTQIISEAPLFTLNGIFQNTTLAAAAIALKIKALSKEQQRTFLTLHNAYGRDLPPLLGTFKTNTHPLGVGATECGIFPTVSRLNHSCIPNANYSWSSTYGRENVYAVRDIAPGEEITVSYLDAASWNSVTTDRQHKLYEGFRFDCHCNACGRSSEELQESDVRRFDMARIDEARRVGGGRLAVTNPAKALRYCRNILELLKDDGVSDMTLYGPYTDAFQLCLAHGDMARASAFAALAMELMETCKGKDSTGIAEIRPLVLTPEKYQGPKISRKWRSQTKNARKVGSEGFEEWLWSRAE